MTAERALLEELSDLKQTVASRIELLTGALEPLLPCLERIGDNLARIALRLEAAEHHVSLADVAEAVATCAFALEKSASLQEQEGRRADLLQGTVEQIERAQKDLRR